MIHVNFKDRELIESIYSIDNDNDYIIDSLVCKEVDLQTTLMGVDDNFKDNNYFLGNDLNVH